MVEWERHDPVQVTVCFSLESPQFSFLIRTKALTELLCNQEDSPAVLDCPILLSRAKGCGSAAAMVLTLSVPLYDPAALALLRAARLSFVRHPMASTLSIVEQIRAQVNPSRQSASIAWGEGFVCLLSN
jgi:hypothetical protein